MLNVIISLDVVMVLIYDVIVICIDSVGGLVSVLLYVDVI